MAQNQAEIRAQIDAVRHRLETDLERLQPIVSRRLGRVRHLAELAAAAMLTIAVARLILVIGPGLRRRTRKKAGFWARIESALRRR
jgi:hypothetical protein